MGKGLLKMAGLGVKKASEVGLDKAKSGVKHCLETKKLLEENQRRWQAATEKYQREVSRLSLIIEKTQSVIGLCKRYGLTDGEIPYPIVHALEKEFPDCKLQQDGSFLFKGLLPELWLPSRPWAERRYWGRPRQVRPLPASMALQRPERPWPILAADP